MSPERQAHVSIPFRAVTGFERVLQSTVWEAGKSFQSLSGLSLGLNFRISTLQANQPDVSIPFRAVTGFERLMRSSGSATPVRFNPFQG